MTAPTFHGIFPHHWTAEILSQRPMILPSRHFTYPAIAEEVERGALEVLVQPRNAQPFLATCALGFRDPAAPTGIWSMPDPDWLCAVSGGYAYLIDTVEPSRFTFLRYRPVLEILQYLPDELHSSSNDSQYASGGLAIFAGHVAILVWGPDGEVWESDRLSSEGLTNLRIENGVLHGEGWDLMTDKALPFALDLATGKRL